MNNIRVFLFENFQYLEVIFSIYLNRRVFALEDFKTAFMCTVISNIL